MTCLEGPCARRLSARMAWLRSTVPALFVAVPPPATRPLASPAPVPARWSHRTAGHAAIAAHIVPTAIIALTHKGGGLGDRPLVSRGRHWSARRRHDRSCRKNRKRERRDCRVGSLHDGTPFRLGMDRRNAEPSRAFHGGRFGAMHEDGMRAPRFSTKSSRRNGCGGHDQLCSFYAGNTQIIRIEGTDKSLRPDGKRTTAANSQSDHGLTQ